MWKQRRHALSPDDDRSHFYSLVQPSFEVSMPEEYSQTNRETVAQWHGLRLGTIPLNHFLHSIGCNPTSMSAETVEHFLMQCELTKVERKSMLSTIRNHYNMNIDPETARVLRTDSRSFTAVCDFLQQIGRFKER